MESVCRECGKYVDETTCVEFLGEYYCLACADRTGEPNTQEEV